MTLSEYHDDRVYRAYTLWKITHKGRHLRKWGNRLRKAAHAATVNRWHSMPYLGRPATNRRPWIDGGKK